MTRPRRGPAMNDDPLLEAVLDAPDDDAPRLRYAEQLERQGDPRGEFIRLQCSLARLPADDSHRAHVKARAQELLTAHEQEWVAPLRPLVLAWKFRHGFVERVTVTADTFLKAGDTLFRLTPLRQVEFCHADERVAAVAASSHLARLTWLDFNNNGMGDADAEALAASPYVARLTELRLNCNEIGDAGVAALARSPHLGRLRALNLATNLIGPEGVQALAASELLSGLEVLDLSNNLIGDAGVEALAASPRSVRLRELHLSHNGIGSSAVEALIASLQLDGLRHLDLSCNHIGTVGADALAQAPRFPALDVLDLRKNHLSEEARLALRLRFKKHVHL